jgi:two-component system, OmpR family, sensor kinase
MSLRGRLLIVLAALAVAGLAAANVATYLSLRSFLIERVDRTVAASAQVLGEKLARRGHLDSGVVTQLATSAPGVYLALIDPSGNVSWSPPLGLRAEGTPQPRLPASVRNSVDGGGSTFTLHAERGSDEFRARTEPLPDGSMLIVAAPLNEVAETLRRLLLIETLVSFAVVAAIVGLGLWLVRLGLRPLGRIEETASAIAAGDLSRRIDETDGRTEVGRLGRALNTMLGHIEQAFAEKVASEQRLRRFVGDASHELRTPLASVQAYAELFERGARDRPEDLARAMAGIEREARRMAMLVDDLLLLARLDQGRPLERAPVDVSEVARDAVDAARAMDAGRSLELDAPEPVVVIGDRERLRQVVDNLLANVRAHTYAATPAAVHVGRENGFALIEVADEGPGLTEEQAAHVFERFYRADPSRSRDSGSSGLGLAIVAAIAEAHGGGASIDSRPGRGATFRISLPVVAPGGDGPVEHVGERRVVSP